MDPTFTILSPLLYSTIFVANQRFCFKAFILFLGPIRPFVKALKYVLTSERTNLSTLLPLLLLVLMSLLWVGFCFYIYFRTSL